MKSDRFKTVQEIFRRVRSLDPEARRAVLDGACGDDPVLREEIESLLRVSDEQTGEFLEQPALGGGLDAGPDEDMPRRIGRYRIISPIGEGGFAIVYLAEQTEPVRRRVALKIIKPGLDTKQVIARLEAEQQALAIMDHPNVAKVFDAGATETGRPYFVIEYVPGDPITVYCDRHRLTNKQRLQLFIEACEAVQHAHHKGIIHRDIKPSNVLVAVMEGKPQVKVIDFGVAKAISQRLTEQTLFTEHGQLIGTPAYMSPEQAEMGALDIDTRTDIYSLGVLLYELLAGSPPFDPKSLHRAAFDEIQRIIREQDPPKPSTRLSTVDDDTRAAALSHRSDPTTLARELRGDLDWITMKALEKDRTRRYESPSALAMDIRRYLSDEAVLAGPPSAVYRLGKFARRHRAALVGLSAVLVVLVLGITGTTWGLIEAVASRRGESEQRAAAERQAAIADAINDFLINDLLASADPGELGRDVTVLEVLDAAAAGVRDKFAGEPVVEAGIRYTLGKTYRRLGRYDSAEPHLAAAFETLRARLGDNDPDTLVARNELAVLYSDQGRYDEAEPLLLRALELSRRVLGDEHPDTLNAAEHLSTLYRRQGRYDEAEPLRVEVLEGRRRVLGDEHPATLNAVDLVANLYMWQGRYDEAEPLRIEAFEARRRVLGDEHPETLISMSNLGALYSKQGRYDEAEPLYARSLELTRRVLGDEHPDTLTGMNNLAQLYHHQGRYGEAEPLHARALELSRRVLGDEHPDTLYSMNNLALLYMRQGRLEEAEPLCVEMLELGRRGLGNEHPFTLNAMQNLGALYRESGRYDEAMPLLAEGLEVSRRLLGDEHPNTLEMMANLAWVYSDLDLNDDAEPLFRDALELSRRAVGEEHPRTARFTSYVASLCAKVGRYEEAEQLYLQAIECRRRLLGAGHPETVASVLGLAGVYGQQGRYDEAESLLIEFHRLEEDRPAAATRRRIAQQLVDLYDAWGKPEKAAEYRAMLKGPET